MVEISGKDLFVPQVNFFFRGERKNVSVCPYSSLSSRSYVGEEGGIWPKSSLKPLQHLCLEKKTYNFNYGDYTSNNTFLKIHLECNGTMN